METLLSLTSKRAGDWFKEELRLLGGLDHIVDKGRRVGFISQSACQSQVAQQLTFMWLSGYVMITILVCVVLPQLKSVWRTSAKRTTRRTSLRLYGGLRGV